MRGEDEVHVPALYMLTAITGRRRNEGREIVSKSGIVIDRRAFHLALLGTLVVGPVAAMFATVMGVWALMVYLVGMGVWFWVWRTRDRGLRVSVGQATWDRVRSEAGRTIQCGQVISQESFEQFQLVTGSQERTEQDVLAQDEPLARFATASPAPTFVAPVATIDTPPVIVRTRLDLD